jgi:hypothetical protein
MAIKAWILSSKLKIIFLEVYKIFKDLKQVIIFGSTFLILQEFILDAYFSKIKAKQQNPSK